MSDPIRFRPTPWNTVILVCGKCSRKLGGGFGPKGKSAFRVALRDELKQRGHKRDVRIVETKCFGVCPKKAVVALNGGAPGRLLTIPRGADPGKMLGTLLAEVAS